MDQISIDDMGNGHNEWRNIQDIVRETFKALSLTVKKQEQQISYLERELQLKADKNFVEVQMDKKPDKRDFEEFMVNTSEALKRKSDNNQVKAAIEEEMKALEGLRDELESKADRSYVATELQQKVSISDVNDALSQKANKQSVVAALHLKANKSDLDNRLSHKVDLDEMTAALSSKADIEVVEKDFVTRPTKNEVARIISGSVTTLREDFVGMLSDKASHSEVAKKVSLNDAKDWLMAKADRSELEEKAGVAEVSELLGNKVERADFVDWSSRVDTELQNHYNQLERALNTRADDLSKKHELTNQTVAAHSDKLSTLKSDVLHLQTQKASAEDMSTLLAEKAGVAAVQESLDMKANVSMVEELETRAASVDEVNNAIGDLTKQMRAAIQNETSLFEQRLGQEAASRMEDAKASLSATMKELDSIKTDIVEIKAQKSDSSRLQELERKLVAKSNVNDMCALLDMKANIEDVNNALSEVNSELDAKAPVDELRRTIEHQAFINDSLCAEHAVGRWLWKSGRLKTNGTIPWNVESVNSCIDNFVFEKDKTSILIKAPGLYELSFGFFGRKRPTVQVLVNGEPVLSAINTPNSVVHHPPRQRHHANNITGMSLVEFISLSPQSRVSLCLSGLDPASTEGFMALKKM